jgi:CBS domain-containing membrane protein
MKRYEIRVRDLMSTGILTVNAAETIAEAHAEMEVGVVRHLPVVDDRGRLVGVLSDRDILRVLSSKKPRRVSEVMSRDVITTRPEANAYAAADLMLDHKISSVPVVDETGALVGLVTQTDYVELARRALLGLPLER